VRAKRRLAALWLAAAVSFGAAAWGVTQLLNLTRFGLVTPFELAAIALASLAAIGGVLLFRWWGLFVGAVLAGYVITIATYASIYSFVAVLAFYVPLACAATVNHRHFKWFK